MGYTGNNGVDKVDSSKPAPQTIPENDDFADELIAKIEVLTQERAELAKELEESRSVQQKMAKELEESRSVQQKLQKELEQQSKVSKSPYIKCNNNTCHGKVPKLFVGMLDFVWGSLILDKNALNLLLIPIQVPFVFPEMNGGDES